MNAEWIVALLVVGILGGEATDDYPECVAVGSPNSWCCSGTLIAPNVVITAGYCARECAARVFVGSRVKDRGQEYQVRKVIVHPGHDPVEVKNDLAVLVLDKDVPNFRLPRLAPKPLIDGAGVLRVIGFGLNTEGGGFGVKRLADIPVVTSTCEKPEDQARYGGHAQLEMVAKDPMGLRDANNGDGGGPAYVRDNQGAWLLAAMTSRASKDSVRPSGDGGIYLRLDPYWDWIRTTAIDNGGHWPNHP